MNFNLPVWSVPSGDNTPVHVEEKVFSAGFALQTAVLMWCLFL